MNNVIIAENNTHPEDDINIAKEFNIILDSVADESSFTHDRYLRFAFANPKRMAELLELYARRKPSLREFLDTINISTLRGVPENFSSDKHAGSADLVFEADLKTGGKAGLFVGIIAEHKSDIDDNVMRQISEYHHHLFAEKKKDVPVVAFIVYNGADGWDPLSKPHFADYPEYYHDIGYPFKVEFLDIGHDIDDAELKCFSPMTLVALTSLKYIFNEEKFTVSFREAAAHLLKLDRSPEGRDFIKQSLSYFLWRWPNKHKDIKMDRPEIVAKRGYETFAEHYVNKGHADAIDIMREVGISHEQVAEVKKRLAALNK
ncbi:MULTISPECIES: Rpn family recombination-promoting nuclease/putative transposase [unclassified Fibrobacter]|uniref:Rpn family recombination-promoting nuclease/putative transposase n=1 Tax=unclassified Fibrobacter TaxID=2634177 RepID=UPI0009208030|nr:MULTISPECIES: Rpn family recombination-promoting nuclease/putative transposase [unclassified Fibrobacter]MBS7272556.1 Rpn family recombination-promoting nuclease/putative transposase [Fibrobacter sp.]MCI6436575.1 Rpn family recombination-promoting nuclease/putative transposase [Fibrobacter sp.]MDD7499040.1 Rpn family recombination-promoting nuclease/putative transposase [Fibrobacter sp.]MDY5724387.1 Rpn family recombination-promoting nuclease/putative transposase [Fibrobacter sp.]SHL43296.1